MLQRAATQLEPLVDPADGVALHPNALGHQATALAPRGATRAAGAG